MHLRAIDCGPDVRVSGGRGGGGRGAGDGGCLDNWARHNARPATFLALSHSGISHNLFKSPLPHREDRRVGLPPSFTGSVQPASTHFTYYGHSHHTSRLL